MKLSTFLEPDCCWIFDEIDSRDELLRALAERVAEKHPKLNSEDLFAALLAREAKGTTATPEGVALPHAMLAGIERTVVVVTLVRGFVRFSETAAPSDLVFLLLGPPESDWEHLRVLARIARIAVGREALDSLRVSRDESDLYRRLLAEDDKHA